MQKLTAKVVSVHSSTGDNKSKTDQPSIRVELDGVVDDRHRSLMRKAYAGDKQPKGTVRRNERLWSAVSREELQEISEALDLRYPLLPSTLAANLCICGVKQFSRLPKGTILKFPSGAELVVEEYNPPCHDMGTRMAEMLETTNGSPLTSTAFSNAARLTRGLVGVVDVPGDIFPGDEVTIIPYEHPSWLERDED